MKEIILTPEQEKIVSRKFAIGILKQLHKKGMLTDEQLRILLDKQNS
jgi:hypothetical protein